MSIVQELLYIVSNYPGGYRILYDILYDSKAPGTRNQKRLDNTARNALYRLKKKGLVNLKNNGWSITEEGRDFLIKQSHSIKHFHLYSKDTKISKPKRKLIVTFDIPEAKRKYRDWLRGELIGFGFDPIQKSVWFAPILPLPFLKYLKEIKILDHLRFFKAEEDDLV